MPDDLIPTLDSTPSPTPSPEPQAPPVSNDPEDDGLDNSLRKLYDTEQPPESSKKQEAPPAEEPPPQETQGTEKSEDFKGLDDPKNLKPPQGISKANRQGWDKLKSNYSRAFDNVVRLEKKAKDLEALLAQKTTTENTELATLKKQIEELSPYRAMVDIHNDPEFVNNFAQPMQSLQSEMTEILKGVGVSDEMLARIDFTNTSDMSKVIKTVEEVTKDRIAADELFDKSKEFIKLNKKANETVESQKTKFKEHQETRTKKSEAEKVEEEARVSQHLQKIYGAKDDKGAAKFPFINRMVAKPGAPEAELKVIEDHNNAVDAMQGKIQQILGVKKPEERAEVAFAAVLASYFANQNKLKDEKIGSLQQQLAKFNNVTSERRINPAATPRSPKSNETLELDDAFFSAFPQAQRR